MIATPPYPLLEKSSASISHRGDLHVLAVVLDITVVIREFISNMPMTAATFSFDPRAAQAASIDAPASYPCTSQPECIPDHADGGQRHGRRGDDRTAPAGYRTFRAGRREQALAASDAGGTPDVAEWSLVRSSPSRPHRCGWDIRIPACEAFSSCRHARSGLESLVKSANNFPTSPDAFNLRSWSRRT
jgi:hypothetical protein